MHGGFIIDNKIICREGLSGATNHGGGVYVERGIFTMYNGTISNNIAGSTLNNSRAYGGGVFISSNGTFIMNDGIISGNTTNTSGNRLSLGGGVYVIGTFNMLGGTISNNTANALTSAGNSYGGGVYVDRGTNAIFTKTGGTIYGFTDGSSYSNAVRYDSFLFSDRGHAVFVNHDPVKRREATAGSEVNMDSNISGVAGGWLP